MEDEIIIYVAGNPNFYPVEYYDLESETYQGMIPELLRDFSEQTLYDVRYYMPGDEDLREQLAKNTQVDIISGCFGGESFLHQYGREMTLLKAEIDGKEEVCRLLLTKTAPDSFEEELSQYLDNITQESKTGLLIQSAEQPPVSYRKHLEWTVLGLLGLTLLLGIVIACVLVSRQRERKRREREKETDLLTGLGNTESLRRNFRGYINDQNRLLYSMSYLHIDTEHMDRMIGRTHTNEFLQGAATILRSTIAPTDILARVSDGGFAVLRLSPSENEAIEWSLPLIQRVRECASVNGAVSPRAAIGVYRLKEHDFDLDEITFRASQSAQAACREGEDVKICTDRWLRELAEERKLQGEIGRGLENGEFLLYIQGYVNSENGRVMGGEALSRWEHPEKGFLTPGRFIPLMEKEGMISQLDFYLLDKACAFLAELQRDGVSDFLLSCNCSGETLSIDNFGERCREIISRYKFRRSQLILEITENTMLQSTPAVQRNIGKLKDLGIRIALDDFGEGFTSLFNLRENTIDLLKLDKTLIDTLGTKIGNTLIRSMIQAGHDLGIITLAEGVEKEEQARELHRMKCDLLQGFFFLYPIPDWELKRQLMEAVQERRRR